MSIVSRSENGFSHSGSVSFLNSVSLYGLDSESVFRIHFANKVGIET